MKSGFIVTSEEGTRLELGERDKPRPGEGQALIRVHASSLNRGELRGGKPGDANPGGAEAAGEVVELGPGANELTTGDRVMGRCKGGFAEYAIVEAAEAMAVPESLSWQQAAAIPIVFLVSYDMLVTYGRLQRDEWVLITAASSGVGVASMQLAAAMGAKVIGTTTSADKLATLEKAGLHHGIAMPASLPDEVSRLTEGHGIDLSINNVGGTLFPELIRVAAYRGRIATVGQVDGVGHAEIDLARVHAQRLEVFGVSNRHRTVAERGETVAGFKRDCLPWFADGAIRPVIDRVFEFEDIASAGMWFDASDHVGKVVVQMPVE